MVMPRSCSSTYEVGDGGALVDVAQAVRKAAVKQHPFGDGGFSGVDMGNDADIAEVLDIVVAWRRRKLVEAKGLNDRVLRRRGQRGRTHHAPP